MLSIELTAREVDFEFAGIVSILTMEQDNPVRWQWERGNHRSKTKPKPLQSTEQVPDLVAALGDDFFLIVSMISKPQVFTQCWREGNQFDVECMDKDKVLWSYGGRH